MFSAICALFTCRKTEINYGLETINSRHVNIPWRIVVSNTCSIRVTLGFVFEYHHDRKWSHVKMLLVKDDRGPCSSLHGNGAANSLGLDTWPERRKVSLFVSISFSLFFYVGHFGNRGNKKWIYIQIALGVFEDDLEKIVRIQHNATTNSNLYQ